MQYVWTFPASSETCVPTAVQPGALPKVVVVVVPVVLEELPPKYEGTALPG
jgi:hypothetical protein